MSEAYASLETFKAQYYNMGGVYIVLEFVPRIVKAILSYEPAHDTATLLQFLDMLEPMVSEKAYIRKGIDQYFCEYFEAKHKALRHVEGPARLEAYAHTRCHVCAVLSRGSFGTISLEHEQLMRADPRDEQWNVLLTSLALRRLNQIPCMYRPNRTLEAAMFIECVERLDLYRTQHIPTFHGRHLTLQSPSLYQQYICLLHNLQQPPLIHRDTIRVITAALVLMRDGYYKQRSGSSANIARFLHIADRLPEDMLYELMFIWSCTRYRNDAPQKIHIALAIDWLAQ